MIARRRAKAALPWMPRALQPHAGPRAVPPARPGPVLRAVRFALLALALGGVLLWSAPAEAQTATVLIKNTGQADSGDYGLGVGGNSMRAQAFTTGANPAGYTLSSIGFSFGGITSTSTAGADLAVTLNGVDSDDNPDAALCTLTDPGTFSGSGVQTFDAPTTDPCETLEANKTYFAVVQRVANTATSTISLDVTADDNEDTGGAMGWSIGDASYVVVTTGTAWVENADFNHQVEVNGYAVNNPATGAPTITGTPRVGEELTADTSAIMDADGLTNPGYSYQWVRVVGGSTTNIGTDSSTYTLTDDDAEKRIRVDVTFTDDLTNAEGPLSSALSDTIVPADVLVRNTGQTARSAGEDFDSLSPDLIAQGFTTGANAGGYTLDSIGVHFWSTADAFSPAANRISATLNADSSSEPGAELCSLTNPATFGASGLHPFAAPTMGTTCPTLHADTTYWVLVKNTATRSSRLSATDSGNEDPGGAAGWSIGDLHSQRQGPASTNAGDWINNFPRSILIEVKGSAADNNFATGAPSISGVLQQDEVLTADTAGIADADGLGTLSYQWLADGTPISGATSSTYTLTASEVRDAISLTVTFTDDEGYSESLTSAETPDVVATGATRKLLWVGTLTPADRGSGAVGVNTSTNVGSLSPFKFTYGSDTYTIAQIDFGPLPSSGLFFVMSPVPAADEEEAWIVDTGREWLVTDDVTSVSGGQIFMSWAAVAEDVDWTVGEETVVYLLEVVNNPPEFTDTAPTTRSVDENTASATNIGSPVAATDPESDTLVYALTGTDASSFTIDSTSGQLKTSASLDFETDSSYSVNVTVHDGKDAVGVADTTVDATIAVTISVNNKDEAGTVTLPATFTGGTAATASVSDPDGTVSGPSWRWARGNTATGSFSNISGATSAGYTPVAADVGEYLRATVTYTDPQGSGKSASAVSSGAVGASNAEPTFDDGATATRTLPENSGAGVAVVGGVVAATDGDSDTLTYSLTGTDAARFEIDSSGQIKVKTGSTHTFNFEAAKKSYSVTVNVRDSKDAAGNADTVTDDTIAVTINLTNVNEAPEITNLLTESNVPENSSGTILLMASDVDVPDTQTWSVETTDDGSKFQVASGFLPTLSFKDQPDFETPIDVGDTAGNNTYVVTVKLTDSGGLSDTLTFTVTVTNVNEAPEITTNSGAAYIFSEAENTATSEVIETFEATDVDASTTLTWSLQGADAGDFTITPNADGEGELKFRNVPDFEDPKGSLGTDRNVYIFEVKVRDNGSPREEDTIGVNLHVTDVNEAPVIDNTQAGISKQENETFVVAFTASDVDDSTTLTWSIESADDGGKFEINATTGVVTSLSFKNAPDFETPTDVGDTAMNNTYVVTMKVTDDGSPAMSDTHKYTVTVTNVNEPPKITTLEATYTGFNVDENTATSVVIKTYEAEDPDANSVLTWDLHGDDAGDFTITKNPDGHGELKFRNVPNFEMPVDDDTDNAYDVIVRVRDAGGLSTTIMVQVTVTDVNETPVVSGDNSPAFAEIEYDVLDADLTAANYIIATYSATDDDNSDNANLQTITWDVSGDDAAHFTIDSSSGVLSFSIRPDFENAVDMGSANTYEIVVEADDGQGESNSVGTFTVTVTVDNVDETPEITTDGTSHTAPSFMEIEYDANSADLNVVVYAAEDEEDGTTGITWSLSGTDAGDFTISTDTATGMGTLTFRNPPNYEIAVDGDTDNDYEITVRASDTTGTTKTREMSVVVTVTDVNERPDIDENFDGLQEYMEIEYDADTAMDGVLREVHTFSAEDYDDGDTFTWSLEGEDAADLAIDQNTGVLTFNQSACANVGNGPLPDFEEPCDDAGDGSNTYSITVQATDNHGKTTDYAVVVTVTDVNEAPEFSGTPDTAITLDEHDANDNYVVMDLADYDARDEEGGVSWSLTGTDRRDFAISADGVVTFAETPNYEAPEDSGGDNVYEFTVVATDVQSGSSRRTVGTAVTVTVGDVEEAGTLAADNLSPAAGETLTFRLTDPDGGIDTTNMTWVIQSLATGGSWARVSGVLTPAATTFPWTVDEDETGKAIRAMVTYTDRRGSGKTALSQETAEVTADPIANAPPRFRGVSSWFVEEGPAGGAVGAPTTATDRDNDTLTYGIQSGQDSARFEIDPSSGQVRLAQALDFETTPGPLFFYLTLHDGKGVDSNNVEVADSSIDITRSADVHVVDVEEDGVVTLSDEEPGVATALTATLEDGDGGVSGPVWQWARSQNGRTGWTNISGATSSGYTTTLADAGFFLRATVTYADRRGGGKSAEGITSQRVFGENQRPTFPPAEDGQRAIPENTRAGVSIGAPVAADDPESGGLTYSLSGTDAAAFTIVTSTGQLRVRDALDFEAKPSHSVTVEVHDGLDGLGNASMTVDDTQAVTITVENVEEPGAVTLSTASGTMQARVEVTAALRDEDGPTVVAWQWSRSPNGRTDWVNIAGATSATYTPTLEEDRGNYLRATASYTDGHGPNKTAAQVSARVGDPPPVNSPPVFPQAEDGQREVAENAAGGTAVGPPVEATDLNAGDAAVNDPLVYSLSGTDAASFDIDSGSGQLRVASGVELDYEGKRSYRVTVEVSDGRDQNGDDDMAAIDARQHVTITVTNVNEAPVVTGDSTASFEENSSSAVASYTAADPERDTLTWSVSGDDFWISDRGQLYFRTPPSYEGGTTSYTVTVTATDDDADGNLSGSLSVTVTVTDVEEEGTVTIEPLRGWDGTTLQAGLDDGDGGVSGETWQWERSSNRSSWSDIAGATSDTYTASSDDVDRYLRVTVTYEDTRGSGKEASAALTGRIEDSADRPISNTAPAFTETAPERSVGQGTAAGRNVGAPVRATDGDTGDILTYSLSGTDAMLFDIDPTTGQLLSRAVLDYDPDGTNSYSVQVRVHDGYGPDYQSTDVGVDATTEVTITVTAAPATRGIVGGGGGGGGGGGPSPSTLDFEWTVTHDIESLDPTHDSPTGAWSDGATLWVLENGDGADDAVYAYDLESGERVEEREFKLDERNRAPRGVWSDGETLWVSDSGQNKLFAYDLETGERLPERDIALAERNAGARGIWSDGERMYVLDSIFVYDLESGELLAECALDAANGDPRGIWSDGVTVWVSDHGAKRLFAYRLPVRSGEPDAGEEDEGDKELERVRDEEFPNTILSRASNNSPRGLWSDGDVMYVADASDGKVYSYNMPDAIDARLASLTMSGIEIGEFSARETEYTGVAAEGVAETTVEAAAVQSGAGVVIDPPDAGGDDANGHQVGLAGVEEIAVTVTSADGSREKTYRVALADAEATPEAWSHCLRGDVTEGFSLLVYEGGGVGDLVACAESRSVVTLYALHEGVYVSYILGAPEWVNAEFGELFGGGVPPVTPLTVKSNGPPSADPNAGDGALLSGAECLRGEIAVGFSLVLSEGGSVDELVACAQDLHVAALYALHEGDYVSYILGAPEWVNAEFGELFPEGVPPLTPLVVRSEGPAEAN